MYSNSRTKHVKYFFVQDCLIITIAKQGSPYSTAITEVNNTNFHCFPKMLRINLDPMFLM